MNLVNEFLLNAPRDAVWQGLTNPEIAAPCMPGTQLTERVGDLGFKATVSLKVGPVKLQFLGEGELMNLASDQSYGEVVAKGSDAKGRGSFKAEMKFRLSEESASQTKVQVETELTLTGSVAQYGRGVGIVKEIASQLTSEFTRNLEQEVIDSRAGGLSPTQPMSDETTGAEGQASSQAPYGREKAEPQGPSINVMQLVFTGIFRWIRSFFSRKA
jgi:carbon monoxide dehydrogenase subunit G